ncbi:MAG: carboxypeptidase-like regulatory domain-containing protein [Longimicrobiales bacterium]
MRIFLWILVFLGLGFGSAEAQVVRGLVTEDETEAPLVGAMVILFEADGEPVDRFLTDHAGEFVIDTDHPGQYYLRVDRIGYASLTTEPFDVPVNGTFQKVSVPIRAIQLRGLDVSGARRCEVRPEEGQVTARVWEEARKALAAAAWTQATGVYRYTLLHYTREMDRDAERILDESRQFLKGSIKAPFESVPVAELIEKGFVQEVPDSGTIYHAPDANVFLSDEFLDTHCLGVRRGSGGLLGLTFAPIESRELPDVEGVLWLKEDTGQLERLRFSYVNLTTTGDVGEPGGEVLFTRLPNGTWIVRDWWIRMPLLEVTRRRGLRRTGYRDEGGVAWRVTDRSGEIVLEAATTTISGTVLDSIRFAPPATAVTVLIDGAGDEVPTEADGAFLLPDLPEGLYSLQVRHPLLDSLGIAAPAHSVQSELGEMVHMTLRVPTLADALTAQCGGAPRPQASAPILGRVVTEAGRPMAEASVEMLWVETSTFTPPSISVPEDRLRRSRAEWRPRSEDGYTVVKTETDGRGIFVLCDVPYQSRLRLDIQTADGRTASRRPVVRSGAVVTIVIVEFEEGR